MLYHTANPASPDGEVSLKADRVLANSLNSQKYPAQLKTNTALQTLALERFYWGESAKIEFKEI